MQTVQYVRRPVARAQYRQFYNLLYIPHVRREIYFSKLNEHYFPFIFSAVSYILLLIRFKNCTMDFNIFL